MLRGDLRYFRIGVDLYSHFEFLWKSRVYRLTNKILSDAGQWNYIPAISWKLYISKRKILFLRFKRLNSNSLITIFVTTFKILSILIYQTKYQENIFFFFFNFLNNHWMCYLFLWSFLIYKNDIHNLFHSIQKHANIASYIFLRIQTTDLLQVTVLSTRNINMLHRNYMYSNQIPLYMV